MSTLWASLPWIRALAMTRRADANEHSALGRRSYSNGRPLVTSLMRSPGAHARPFILWYSVLRSVFLKLGMIFMGYHVAVVPSVAASAFTSANLLIAPKVPKASISRNSSFGAPFAASDKFSGLFALISLITLVKMMLANSDSPTVPASKRLRGNVDGTPLGVLNRCDLIAHDEGIWVADGGGAVQEDHMGS